MFNSRKEFFLIFIFLFSKTSCLLNLEELNNVDYGIDILSKPLLLREFPSSQSVVLTSIYGQDYQCVIPDHAKDEEIKKEKEKIAVEIGIPDLLKPMESSPCLIYTKDWWTYEFCYGKYIKQYHLQKDEISGVITYLGYYESEYNWSDKTQNKTNSRLDKYHSQRYVNGTTCDLTNNPRETEVRFKCDDVGGDHISHINEPETCFYIVTVNTNKVCHHPYLRPPVTKNGVDIKCNPLLSQEEMNEYQNTVEKDLKKKKEIDDAEKKEKEVNLEELSHVADKESENSDKSESSNEDELLAELDTKTTSSLKKLFTDALTESIQEIMDENEDMDEFVAVGGQELKNLMDTGKMEQVIKKLLDDTSEKLTSDSKSKESSVESNQAGIIDNDIITTYEDNLESKDSTVTEINILDENSFSQLENVPEKLKDFDIKKDYLYVKTHKNGLQQWIAYNEKGEEEVLHEEQLPSPEEKSEIDASNEVVEERNNGFDESKQDVDVQIQVAKISIKNENEDEKSIEEDGDDSESDMQKKIKEALEDSELDTSGKKFEIKIITRGYYSKEDNSFHLLDGDKNTAFDSIIISLLNSDSKSVKELKNHKELQNNYEFVWSKKDKNKD